MSPYLSNRYPASSSYRFPWNVGSYLVALCLCCLVYLLFNAVYTSSSSYTVSTTTFLSLSISCKFTSSPKESVSLSLLLLLSMTTPGSSYTILGTPVILVVMLAFLVAASDLYESLNSFSATALSGIIFFVSSPGKSAASSG